MVPPLPDRQSLHRLIEMCEREAWLFGAINTFALSDVMILLETAPANDTDTHTATAVMLALVATALPLLAPACPAGIRSSTIFTSIDARLRKSGKLDGVSMNDTMEWISTVCKFYADAARDLLSQVQGNSESQTLIASLVVRVLLVECSLGILRCEQRKPTSPKRRRKHDCCIFTMRLQQICRVSARLQVDLLISDEP